MSRSPRSIRGRKRIISRSNGLPFLYKLLDMDDGELTKTGKIRRKFVREKYQNLYEALYDESIERKGG